MSAARASPSTRYMRTILVTNDDGVESEGVQELARALGELGLARVVVCAPLGEASAIGHALTLARPLRLHTLRPDVHAVDGTPADCVNVGVAQVLEGQRPDLVVSGINKGWNVGDDVTYSGTVGGALEGVLLGVPAIAVSLQRAATFDFGPAARAGAQVARDVLAHGLPPRVLLNVNVPKGEPVGWAVTRQAART
ncbi:MAG TPA: 5'/3'-nucleotidase SurE, partial [Luteitalea sp.]|nr:5'/3'-nucleotidase SurE [Luteitalea sp.]